MVSINPEKYFFNSAVTSNRIKEIFWVVNVVIKSHIYRSWEHTVSKANFWGQGLTWRGVSGIFWHKLFDLIRSWLTQVCTFAKTQ